MPHSRVNTVAQAEYAQRDSHTPALSHAEDAEEKWRRVVLGLPELSNVYPQDAAVEAANPGNKIPAKGCRHLLVKPWANGTGK